MRRTRPPVSNFASQALRERIEVRASSQGIATLSFAVSGGKRMRLLMEWEEKERVFWKRESWSADVVPRMWCAPDVVPEFSRMWCLPDVVPGCGA